jgi:hypothetical protein
VSGRFTLLPRLPVENVGLITIWNDSGAYITLSESVFRRRAPGSIGRVEEASGLSPIGQGRSVHDPSDELLRAVADAYRETRA